MAHASGRWEHQHPFDASPLAALDDGQLTEGQFWELVTGLGPCTRDPEHGPAEVPYSGEKLCWDCADRDLDLLAKAVMAADEPEGYTDKDTLLDNLANELLRLADGCERRVDSIIARLEAGEVTS
jgi:hypothetical protein